MLPFIGVDFPMSRVKISAEGIQFTTPEMSISGLGLLAQKQGLEILVDQRTNEFFRLENCSPAGPKRKVFICKATPITSTVERHLEWWLPWKSLGIETNK